MIINFVAYNYTSTFPFPTLILLEYVVLYSQCVEYFCVLIEWLIDGLSVVRHYMYLPS